MTQSYGGNLQRLQHSRNIEWYTVSGAGIGELASGFINHYYMSTTLWFYRYRWHSIGITAEQAAMVWACAVKRRWWLGEEMPGVWSRGSKTKRKTKEDLERGCGKGLQACKENKEDAVDRSRWKKLIKDVWWSGWVWVGRVITACSQQRHAGSKTLRQQNPPILNWRYRLTQIDLYNGRKNGFLMSHDSNYVS